MALTSMEIDSIWLIWDNISDNAMLQLSNEIGGPPLNT